MSARRVLSIFAYLACVLCSPVLGAQPEQDERALHEKLLVLDTHLDTPLHFGRPGWSILDRHTNETDLSQVDYPRMIEGGLDGGFWVIFTEQGPLTAAGYAAARDHALKRSVQIREMVSAHSAQFELALTADDAERIVRDGRRVVYQSIENAYPLGTDLTLLQTFQQLGVRLIGPVHSANNQFADSATDESGPKWNGLGPLGKQLVAEANRLGLVLDASHASDAVFDQMLALSKTPIILSHSGLKAIHDHPRNIDDARLRRLAAAGGVIHVLAVNEFYTQEPQNAERDEAFEQTGAPLERANAAQAAQIAARIRELNAKYSVPLVTFDAFMRALLHAIKVAGVDHVGLGIDWDGGGGFVGFEDITFLPKVTAGLRQAGYSSDDINKIAGGNVLRVLRQAEDYARAGGTDRASR